MLLLTLRYCNGICLNLYLKILQKTSYKLEIHIYSQIFENWVNFFRLKYNEIQDICNTSKESPKIINDKIILLLKSNKKYARCIL